MTINYQQEILNLLQNKINIIPSIALISANREVALLVWKNFITEKNNSNIDDWYNEGNWKKVLSAYQHDVLFWEKAIHEHRFGYDFLLLNEFREDFPFVIENYFNDNEKMTEIFLSTGDIEFFNELRLHEKDKKEVYKKYLREDFLRITPADMNRYKDDIDFIEELVLQNSCYFSFISNKTLKDNLIEKVLKQNKDNFKGLSSEDQTNYFSIYYEIYRHQIRFYELPELAWKDKKTYLLDNSDEFLMFFSKNYESSQENILDLLKDNPLFIHQMSNDIINFIFKKSPHHISIIKEYLIDFITTYTNIGISTDNESKILKIISLDNQLQDSLHNNPYYQLKKDIDSFPKIITLEQLDEGFKKIHPYYLEHKISLEVIEKALNLLKQKLPQDISQEARIPKKNIYHFFSLKLLNEELQINLDKKSNSPGRKL